MRERKKTSDSLWLPENIHEHDPVISRQKRHGTAVQSPTDRTVIVIKTQSTGKGG